MNESIPMHNFLISYIHTLKTNIIISFKAFVGLLFVCCALLCVRSALLCVHTALLCVCRALLCVCRALFECAVLFSTHIK